MFPDKEKTLMHDFIEFFIILCNSVTVAFDKIPLLINF